MENKRATNFRKVFGLQCFLALVPLAAMILIFTSTPASADPGWWSTSWDYRQIISISNTAENLTNYQLKIQLNSSTVGGNFNWVLDENATRFTYYNVTSGSETPIHYWIENWSSTSQNADIWIKIPFLENNTNTTFYMYYGNPSASSASNGTNTFKLFDDFEDGNDNGWTEHNGNWHVVDNTYHQSADLSTYMRTSNGDSSWGNYTLETKINISSGGSTGGFAGVLFRFQDTGNHYAVILDDRPDDSIWIRQWIGGGYSTGPQMWTDVTINRDTWYDLRVDVFDNAGVDTIRAHFNGITHEYNYTQYDNGKIALMMHGTQAYYDNIRVRKYASPEPSVSNIGGEEYQLMTYWVKTYTPENKARSFFGINETVTIKTKGDFDEIPAITIADSNSAIHVNSMNMTDQGNTYVFNYILNGSNGWYDVHINDKLFEKSFYQGEIWQDNWTDAGGNTFPFRIQVNVSEPNVIERFFEPIDIHLNFTYKANENSVRVCSWNGSNLIEVPSQVYNSTYQTGYVIAGNVVFSVSLSENENRIYYIYYMRSDPGPPNYPTDLNVTNTSDFYEIQNVNYRVGLNKTKGGVIQEAYNKKGSNKNLAGFNPMQLSPSAAVGPYTYRASDLTTPTITLTTGSLLTIYKTEGEAGTMKFNLTYKFYSHTPYFTFETNVTPKASETWQHYKNQIFYLVNGVFPRLAFKNTTGIFDQDLANKLDLLNIDWLAFYNNISGNGFGEIFLERQQSKSYNPDVDVYDESGYEYFERTQYAGAVTDNDYFYSKVAVILWNALDNYRKLNETYYLLRNPLNLSFSASETYDAENPVYTIANYTPQAPNDQQNVTCYSYWTDNLELDYAVITINSPAFNDQIIRQIDANESWVNYTLTADILEAGQVTCNITVYDIAGLCNSTELQFNVSDAVPPYFVSIANEPTTDADLDPYVQVNVTVNLTEYTGIGSVILQYRNSSQGWQNVSMNKTWNNSCNYTYSADFTPSSEGIWLYRIYANDTGGNSDYSGVITLSVYYDWTWSHTPADFGVVSGLLASNITVGNITAGNTGDRMLRFRVSSNWDDEDEVFFNDTAEGSAGFVFNLGQGDYTNIPVKVTAKSTERSDGLTLTIDALNSSAQPDSNTTTATIVSYAGGPFLLVTITNYSASVTQGDSGVVLEARLQNKGNETATGVWLAFGLPSGWSVGSGDLNETVGTLMVDEIAYNQITVDVSDTAPVGIQSINALGGCLENKTGYDSVNVVVIEKSAPSPPPPDGGNGGGIRIPYTPPPRVVRPEVNVSEPEPTEPLITKEQKEKLFQTKGTYELVRGREESFTLKVENPFDEVFENVSVDVTGFLAKYLRVEPQGVEEIPVNRSFNFTIWIEAPIYFTKGEHRLNFTITGVVNRTETMGDRMVISIIYVKESRLVTLIIHEISRHEASEYLNESVELVGEMDEAGLNIEEVSSLLSQAFDDFKRRDYGGVKGLYKIIRDRWEKAFAALSLIREVEGMLDEAGYNGINVPETRRLLMLAKAAMGRGDYATALERADDAKLTYALETVGKFNLMAFARNNWPMLGVSVVTMFLVSWLGFIRIKLGRVKRRLKALRGEKDVLLGLIKEIQRECFEKGKLSMEEYEVSLVQYERRLNRVIQETVKFETMKVHLIKLFKREGERLLDERDRLLGLIEANQRMYLESGKLETRVYRNRVVSYTERLTEVEETIAGLEAEKYMRESGSTGLRGLR